MRVIVPTYYLAYAPFKGSQIGARAIIAKQLGVPYTASLPSLTTNFAAKYLVMMLAIPFISTQFINKGSSLIFIGIALSLVTLTAYLLFRYWGLLVNFATKRLSFWFPKLGDRILTSVSFSDNLQKNLSAILRWKSLGAYYVLFISISLVEYAALSLLWHEIGVDINFVFLTALFFAGGMAGFLSQIPGGFGVHELVSASILAATGIDFAQAVSLLVLSRILFLLYDLIISAGGWLLLNKTVGLFKEKVS
jgi:uncharacterized membrane protein YbhN (UPF0104 family)